jgi:hypothetical protein
MARPYRPINRLLPEVTSGLKRGVARRWGSSRVAGNGLAPFGRVTHWVSSVFLLDGSAHWEDPSSVADPDVAQPRKGNSSRCDLTRLGCASLPVAQAFSLLALSKARLLRPEWFRGAEGGLPRLRRPQAQTTDTWP